jgi:hypothetical protein
MSEANSGIENFNSISLRASLERGRSPMFVTSGMARVVIYAGMSSMRRLRHGGLPGLRSGPGMTAADSSMRGNVMYGEKVI